MQALDIIEVDADVVFPSVPFHREIDGSLVDSRVLWELPVLLQVTRLVRIVTVDDVHLTSVGSRPSTQARTRMEQEDRVTKTE